MPTFPTAKPAFPTQSPAGNAPAPSLGGPPSPDMSESITGPPAGAGAALDPVSLITQIQTLLDQLVELVGAPPVEEPEMEPQSDDEIMAGLAPKPKEKPSAPGAF